MSDISDQFATLTTPVQAAIFDMDGVLIDSEPLWKLTLVEVFSELGLPIDMMATDQTLGWRIDEVVRYWFDRHPWTGPSQAAVVATIKERVKRRILEQGTLLPGVLPLMRFFQQRGTPIAIASSSSSSLIDAVVAMGNLDQYLTCTYSAEHEQHGKPHPGVYLTTAELMRIPPTACIAFEDSPAGIIAARAARMLCVAIPNHYALGAREFSIAHLTVTSLTDLLPDHG